VGKRQGLLLFLVKATASCLLLLFYFLIKKRRKREAAFHFPFYFLGASECRKGVLATLASLNLLFISFKYAGRLGTFFSSVSSILLSF